jgi:cyclic nucleotide-binding protein
MIGIPPTLDSDSEDVAWALQTADALWKRNERVDAIVWLRRAAQAAVDADDEDRALTLARRAAELTDWAARHAVSGDLPSRMATAGGRAIDEGVDELLADANEEPTDLTLEDLGHAQPISRPLARDRKVDVVDSTEDVRAARVAGDISTAAEVHSGMLDPWARGKTDSEYETIDPELLEVDDVEEADFVTSAPTLSSIPPTVEVPDLAHIEAFSDLPDDLRDSLAAAAHVQSLDRGDEVSGFALAVVLEGAADVSSAVVDAPVARLQAGTALRSRGTVEQVATVRLVAASDGVRVATWHDGEVARILASCPWVEDELRSAADHTHALVGVTTGAMGERMHPAIRAAIAAKLALRILSDNEVLLHRGQAIAGLHIVGAGELEVFDADGRTLSTLGAGDVVFPGEVLRAATAPCTVRARAGGALVLSCDRASTQELLVTCPPLLELLADS